VKGGGNQNQRAETGKKRSGTAEKAKTQGRLQKEMAQTFVKRGGSSEIREQRRHQSTRGKRKENGGGNNSLVRRRRRGVKRSAKGRRRGSRYGLKGGPKGAPWEGQKSALATGVTIVQKRKTRARKRTEEGAEKTTINGAVEGHCGIPPSSMTAGGREAENGGGHSNPRDPEGSTTESIKAPGTASNRLG